MKWIKLFFPVVMLALSGCAGYHVGSTLDPSIRSVSLSIVNKTDEPSIEVAVMKALRAELQMDGRLEVRPLEEADAVLTVTLTRFALQPLAFNRRQGSQAEEYRMTITASSLLSDAESSKVLLENPVIQGDGEFLFDSDLTTAKRGALPKAAADLARKVVSTTVTAW
jgi:hypothetical protein